MRAGRRHILPPPTPVNKPASRVVGGPGEVGAEEIGPGRVRQLRTALELEEWRPARHRSRNELAEMILCCPLVQERVSNECNQVREFGPTQFDWISQLAIEAAQNWLDRPQTLDEVDSDTGGSGM